jgi:hypothetical protein
MGVGNAAKIFERPQIILFDAVARGVHAAELPLGNGMTVGSGERIDAVLGVAGAQRPRSRHLDGSPHVIRLRRSLYGTSMPGAGAVHHIKTRRQLSRPARPDFLR